MFERMIDDFKDSTGTALRLTSLAAAVAVALFITTSFLCAAAFVFVLQKYGLIEACLTGAGIFFVVTADRGRLLHGAQERGRGPRRGDREIGDADRAGRSDAGRRRHPGDPCHRHQEADPDPGRGRTGAGISGQPQRFRRSKRRRSRKPSHVRPREGRDPSPTPAAPTLSPQAGSRCMRHGLSLTLWTSEISNSRSRHCARAKQSIFLDGSKDGLLSLALDIASNLASKHSFAISRRVSPELCQKSSLPSNQRAQGIPGARCTRGLVCNVHKKTRTRAYRFSGDHSGIPCAMVLRFISCSPR